MITTPHTLIETQSELRSTALAEGFADVGAGNPIPAATPDAFELAVAALSVAHAIDRGAPHRPVHPTAVAALDELAELILPPLAALPLNEAVQWTEAHIRALPLSAQDALSAALALDRAGTRWRPTPGAQALAWESMHRAQQTLLAGGTGSGKSLPALMLAAMSSRAARFVRKTSGEHVGAMTELAKYVGDTTGRNLGTGRWELSKPWGHNGEGTTITFVALGEPGAEAHSRQQGLAADVTVFDDAASGWLSPMQLQWFMNWSRTTTPGLIPRVVLACNPPTSVHGEWIKAMWAPWLDAGHPNPAKSGELRYFDAEAREVPAGTPGSISRTCVTSTVMDNPFLLRDPTYLNTLKANPDPVLRAKFLLNDWNTASEDDPYQVFPARWVDAAFERYTASRLPELTATGLDVARGGRDSSVLAKLHDNVIPPLHRWPGHTTPDGHSLAALVLAARGKSRAPVMVDSIGVGSGAVDALRPRIFEQCVPVNVSQACSFKDPTQTFGFVNVRAWLAWNLRCLLDPSSQNPLAIAPDKALRAELLAYRYSLSAGRIAVDGKDDIVKRLHRSPDAASAVMLACIPTDSTIAQQSTLARAMSRWARG